MSQNPKTAPDSDASAHTADADLIALLPIAGQELSALRDALRKPLPEALTDSQFARHGRAWAAT